MFVSFMKLAIQLGSTQHFAHPAPHQRCQDTLSLYRDEKRERSHWSDVTEDYFAAWRLEAPFDPEHS